MALASFRGMKLNPLLLPLLLASVGCGDLADDSRVPPPEAPSLPAAVCDLPTWPSETGIRIRTTNTPLVGPLTGEFVANSDGLGGEFLTDEPGGRVVQFVDDGGLLDAAALEADPDMTVWAASAVNESEDNELGALFAGDGSLIVQTWDKHMPDAPEDTPDGGFNLSAPADSECAWVPDPTECNEEIRPFPVLVQRGQEQAWLYQGQTAEIDGMTVYLQIAQEAQGRGDFYDKCGSPRYANVLIVQPD